MRSINLNSISRKFGALLLSALMVFAVGCKKSKPVYKAEIRRTAGGIPHIKADDFASLGFGTGYAAAEDNICLLAESILKHRGELSRYFGPGENNENLNSDFFYKLMIDRGLADQEIPPEFEALFRGYVAGYNRYVRDTGIDNLSDPDCQGVEWVGEITVDDIKRIQTMPFFLPNFHPLIVAATPPATGAAAALSNTTSLAQATKAVQNLQTRFAALGNPYHKGSNGMALGRDATKGGKGMLLANPHMIWHGTGRFYPFHQTIPGVMDVLGANIIDRTAFVGFGTTEHVAWTNTVSKGLRYSFYMLQLDPDNPTVYKMDNVPYDMITEDVSVTVLNPDGSLEERTHTFYSTDFGFVIGNPFPWMPGMAFALRVANEGVRGLNGGIAGGYQAETVRELKAAHDQAQYMIVNVIAADASGEVLFGDLGPLANMTNVPFWCFQGPVMVGSSSVCQWCDDPDAAAPGIYPPDQLPSLFRYDYVLNSNDSYWLTNPEEPLTGFNPSLGEVGTERTLRTRSGLKMVQERLDGSDGLGGNNEFTLDQLMHIALSNQNYSAQLLRDDLVTLCEDNPIVDILDADGNIISTVDISEACPILTDWDLHADLDSRGEHLFREFMREANSGNNLNRTLPGSLNYTVDFDPSTPETALTTPRGLDTIDNPATLQALAKAVQKLRDAGIPLDARLGDLQTVTRNNEVIPIHGGQEMEGVFNKIESNPDFENTGGYPEVTGSSSSWIMATEFTEDGPKCKGILTYSISTNPNSPHYSDQTKMYSNKEWLDLPFRDEDVEAAALEKTVITEGISDCRRGGWKEFSQPEFNNCAECLAYFLSLQCDRITEFSSDEED